MKFGGKALAGLLLAAALLQGCEPSQEYKEEENARKVADLLSSDGTGTWQVAKGSTRIKNFAVLLGPDGKYYGVKTDVFDKNQTKADFLAATTMYSNLAKSMDSYQKYEMTNRREYTSSTCWSWSDCTEIEWDDDGNPTRYKVVEETWSWVTYKENIYVDAASGLVFEMGDTTSKDLESVSAAIEAASNDSVRDMLVAGYGLSENRASEIASLAKSWQNIEKSRAMTAKDLVEFQSKVFGSDLGSVKKAAEKAAKGDKAEYEALIKKAAKMNDVSPEQAKDIFNNFLN